MTPAQFSATVQSAIAELPARFRDALQNITIAINHERGEHDLLGLYEGTPLPERTTFDPPLQPDTITLFRHNLEAYCRTAAELRAEIRITLLHEIGHYFGLSEEQLEALGY